jgi:dienelactone hydrolase
LEHKVFKLDPQTLEKESFGQGEIRMFEMFRPGHRRDRPFLVVYFHGAAGPQSEEDLLKALVDIFDAIPGHIIFVCPSNPVAKWCKSMFGWQYTKKQNKHNQGFINGTECDEYVEDLDRYIRDLCDHYECSHVVALGYSMGGFGALQLAGLEKNGDRKRTVDILICMAGHAAGTSEPTDGCCGYKPDQPEARIRFEDYVAENLPYWKKVAVALFIHAEKDDTCYYRDIEFIAEKIHGHMNLKSGQRCWIVKVPDEHSREDYKHLKGKKLEAASHHGYWSYCFNKKVCKDKWWLEIREQLTKMGAKVLGDFKL